MPELPDVETFQQYFRHTALHRTVRAVRVAEPAILENASAPALRRSLTGRELSDSFRHGKYLFVAAGEEAWTAWHFGMTGSLAYYRDSGDEPAHARLVLEFDNDYHLAFDCQRLLGGVWLLRDPEAFLRAHEVGTDALAVGEEAFAGAARGFRGGLKSFLMDQSRLAGIGNVYADEILFRARLAPQTRGRSLDAPAARRLYKAMRTVLRMAIDRKAERARFPRSWLTPRRTDDEPACPRGCGALERGKVNGRTTYWCPRCQS